MRLAGVESGRRGLAAREAGVMGGARRWEESAERGGVRGGAGVRRSQRARGFRPTAGGTLS